MLILNNHMEIKADKKYYLFNHSPYYIDKQSFNSLRSSKSLTNND
jgi:hypothetical protein